MVLFLKLLTKINCCRHLFGSFKWDLFALNKYIH